jgi:hypothetical protein
MAPANQGENSVTATTEATKTLQTSGRIREELAEDTHAAFVDFLDKASIADLYQMKAFLQDHETRRGSGSKDEGAA